MKIIALALSVIIVVAATPATAAAYALTQQRGEAELPWLFAVYAITWAAFFGYVFIMSRRQREMQREIDALNRALQAKDADME